MVNDIFLDKNGNPFEPDQAKQLEAELKENILMPTENIQLVVETGEGTFKPSKLVVTDKRILKWKPGFLGVSVEDMYANHIAATHYSKGIFGSGNFIVESTGGARISFGSVHNNNVSVIKNAVEELRMSVITGTYEEVDKRSLEDEKRFCSNCGAKLETAASFCSSCGSKV